jgi:hypothetical protein
MLYPLKSPSGLLKILSAAGFLLTFLFFYPGFVGREGVDQIDQAVFHIFNDLQPLYLTLLFSLLLKLHRALETLLFVQLGFLWFGIYLVASELNRLRKHLGFALLLVPFFPPLLVHLGTVSKDSFAAAFMLCAIGFLLRSDSQRKKSNRIAAILFLSLTALTRLNGGIFLILPFAFFARESWRMKTAAAVTGAAIALTLSVQFVCGLFIRYEPTHSEQYLMVYDLTGISKVEQKPIYPDFILRDPQFSFDKALQNYTPATLDTLFFIPGQAGNLGQPVRDISELRAFWLRAIGEHTLSYLKHRTDVFFALMTLPKISYEGYSNENVFVHGLRANNQGFEPTENSWRKAFVEFLDGDVGRSLFNPLALFVIASLIIAGGVAYRRNHPSALRLHGFFFLYFFQLFLIAPAAEFRYFIPTTFGLAVAALLGWSKRT